MVKRCFILGKNNISLIKGFQGRNYSVTVLTGFEGIQSYFPIREDDIFVTATGDFLRDYANAEKARNLGFKGPLIYVQDLDNELLVLLKEEGFRPILYTKDPSIENLYKSMEKNSKKGEKIYPRERGIIAVLDNIKKAKDSVDILLPKFCIGLHTNSELDERFKDAIKDRVEKGIKVRIIGVIFDRQQFKCARALERIIGKDRLKYRSPIDLPPDYTYFAIIDKSKVLFTWAKDPDRTMIEEIWLLNDETAADYYLKQFELQWEKAKNIEEGYKEFLKILKEISGHGKLMTTILMKIYFD